MVSITDHDTVDVAALAETRAQADLVMATLGAGRDAEVVRIAATGPHPSHVMLTQWEA